MSEAPITNTIKPCPFCGNKADWNEREASKGVVFYIECVSDSGDFGCCSQRGGFARKSEAIAAWNKRVS